MLLILLYHRITVPGDPNPAGVFSTHLRFLTQHYPLVLPGDPLPSGKVSVCLTFDDAYFDFYRYVFPLLRKSNVPALLSVPTGYIVDRTDLDDAIRLSVPYEHAMEGDVYKRKVPFCTWDELSAMCATGLVDVASHSCRHRNLTDSDADPEEEIAGSKMCLETRLHRKVTTFVYPYGKMNRRIHSEVARQYRYAMRIGSALNKDWNNAGGLLYRINADDVTDPARLFTRAKLSSYLLKYFMNTIRNK